MSGFKSTPFPSVKLWCVAPCPAPRLGQTFGSELILGTIVIVLKESSIYRECSGCAWAWRALSCTSSGPPEARAALLPDDRDVDCAFSWSPEARAALPLQESSHCASSWVPRTCAAPLPRAGHGSCDFPRPPETRAAVHLQEGASNASSWSPRT